MFDFCAALAGLVVAAPIIAIALVAIRMETPGWPLFSQTRIGRRGKPFTCFKLRTMHQGTVHVPTHEAAASAVTPLGQRLRLWKLDELPQLVNVLKGEMSLVGPRPCLPSQTVLIEARQRAGVLNVRPGITGLAQIRGIDMSDPELLARIDAEYVEHASLFGDLRLILATVLGRGVGIDPVGANARQN